MGLKYASYILNVNKLKVHKIDNREDFHNLCSKMGPYLYLSFNDEEEVNGFLSYIEKYAGIGDYNVTFSSRRFNIHHGIYGIDKVINFLKLRGTIFYCFDTEEKALNFMNFLEQKERNSLTGGEQYVGMWHKRYNQNGEFIIKLSEPLYQMFIEDIN